MPDRSESYDAIVLGGGAAGLFCAAIAGQRGRRVLVVEHAASPGKKILISGGGRCNFTNRTVRCTDGVGALTNCTGRTSSTCNSMEQHGHLGPVLAYG